MKQLFETIQQPEYTGENRCLPCTTVNVAIAGIVGLLLSRKSKPAGILAVGLSVGLIYARGYLVPGTPELTKRYLPAPVLRMFGKSPAPDLATGISDSDDPTARTASNPRSDDSASVKQDETLTVPDDLETYFTGAQLLEPCADRDDLCLTDAFETAWAAEIESVLAADEIIAGAVDAFGFDGDLDLFEYIDDEDTGCRLQYDSRDAGRWPSRAALIADIAAGRILTEWIDEWDRYSPREKSRLLNSLRMFLETCPTADGGVRMEEDVVQSCCTASTVVAVVCEETGERIFEHQVHADLE